MIKYKIKQDKSKCIGCGACVALCPKNWKMEKDKSKPLRTEITSLGCNKAAADQCPVQCIKIIEIKKR